MKPPIPLAKMTPTRSGIDIFFCDAGIFNGFVGGHQCKLAVTDRFSGLLLSRYSGGVKILNLTGKSRFKLCNVELFDKVAPARQL